MFEYMHGRVVEKSSSNTVIDVNGIGYIFEISQFTSEQLPENGQDVRLFVHFHVREDIQKLYGFITDLERELFRLLIGINKIGPKVALSILSSLSVSELVRCINSGDISRFKSVSGVGPTTAQRLVVELKNKIKHLSSLSLTSNDITSKDSVESDYADINEDAYAALISLGYSELQVQKSLTRVRETINSRISVEEWIKKALKVM